MKGIADKGTVVDFDEHVGLGSIVSAAGDTFRFHCTRITDGSRRIEPRSSVSFVVVPGRHGSWEAASVQPLPASPDACT